MALLKVYHYPVTAYEPGPKSGSYCSALKNTSITLWESRREWNKLSQTMSNQIVSPNGTCELVLNGKGKALP